MIITMLQNETRSISVKNRTISGVNGYATMVHGTANTALQQGYFDMSKVQVKVTLKRGGREFTLAMDNLKVLAFESGFFSSQFESFAPSNTASTPLVLLAPAVGVFSMGIVPWVIEFGGPINVSGNDELLIEMQTTGIWNSALNTTTSSFSFGDVETIGVEKYTPYIKSKSISPGDSTAIVDAGSNIMGVAFINFDKTTILSADACINSVQLNSDRVSMSLAYNELLTRRADQFNTAAAAALRSQSFYIAQAEEMDRVRVDLNLTSANITNGNNYIVTRNFYSDKRLFELGEVRSQVHSYKRAIKFGMKVQSDVLNRLEHAKSVLKK